MDTCRKKNVFFKKHQKQNQHQNIRILITTEPLTSQYSPSSIHEASSLVTLSTDFSRHRFSFSDPVAKEFLSLNNQTTCPVYFPLKPCPRGQVYRLDNTGQKIMS